MVTSMTRSAEFQPGSLARRDAVAALLKNRRDTLVVAGLGSSTYDLHWAGDRDDNYYLWGAMGGAALIGLGLAQAQPDRRVLVITGDGEQLMALGSLATPACTTRRAAALRHQGRGGKSSALPAVARCRVHQEPVSCPSRLLGRLRQS